MNNYRLTLSYDGTKYNGWQRLSNTENTIQHKVEITLSRLLEQKTEVSLFRKNGCGSSRQKADLLFSSGNNADL